MNGVSERDVERVLLRMERSGMVERTGELRDGQPVWVTTAPSKHTEETVKDEWPKAGGKRS